MRSITALLLLAIALPVSAQSVTPKTGDTGSRMKIDGQLTSMTEGAQ